MALCLKINKSIKIFDIELLITGTSSMKGTLYSLYHIHHIIL